MRKERANVTHDLLGSDRSKKHLVLLQEFYLFFIDVHYQGNRKTYGFLNERTSNDEILSHAKVEVTSSGR